MLHKRQEHGLWRWFWELGWGDEPSLWPGAPPERVNTVKGKFSSFHRSCQSELDYWSINFGYLPIATEEFLTQLMMYQKPKKTSKKYFSWYRFLLYFFLRNKRLAFFFFLRENITYCDFKFSGTIGSFSYNVILGWPKICLGFSVPTFLPTQYKISIFVSWTSPIWDSNDS